MFNKILIANRGEIACRVIRTARRMGIATVAVYSEADRDALHVRMADEAVCIGPPPSADSYLAIDNILGAVAETGAEAVHPGYGFLAENAAFVDALAGAGVAFIGPPAGALTAMGDKIQSKKLALKAGVYTIPGHPEAIKNAAQAVGIASGIGYPVMVKASAGGGGKGMRIAASDDEVREGFAAAKREAKSSFGDDRILIEKFIEQPRHIEIQVLFDGHGNGIYLHERECSIQRRHQKVVEEAPSPFIDADSRRAMGEQALQLARAVDYVSAGTVEFIVDAHRDFYFLEMNTRLQVEHPVTEYITGLDLVELMIRVAAGEKLPIAQSDVRLEGWAIETRIYAEDPHRGFLPAVGRLTRYRAPEVDGGNVRVDTGVYEGGEVSVHYDPLIAKLITYGADRGEAIGRMRAALDAYLIRGVPNNIGFLAAVMGHPRFAEGRLTTDFIAEEYGDGFDPTTADGDPTLLIAAAVVVHYVEEERAAGISGRLPGRERRPEGDWVAVLGGAYHPVGVTPVDGGFETTVDGRTCRLSTGWKPFDPFFRAEADGVGVCIQIDRLTVGYRLNHGGRQADIMVLSPRVAELHALMPLKEAADTSRFLQSPMPGLLTSVAVEAGQQVKAGQELAVVEAMKMENVLRAAHDGVVATVHASPGDGLAVDQIILEFE